MNINSVSG